MELVSSSDEVNALLAERMDAPRGPDAERDVASESSRGSVRYPPPLVRTPLSEDKATRLFAALERGRQVFDPVMFLRQRSNETRRCRWPEHPLGGWDVVTNSLGMREDSEPLAVKPDVRILVTGDSHTAGLCPNQESFTNVLEQMLAEHLPDRSVEALNAGSGGYSPYNYLGVLERYRELQPDVAVIVVYGGNDFSGMLRLERYFRRRGPYSVCPIPEELTKELAEPSHGLIPQELSQLAYFVNNPGDEQVAIDTLASISVAMQEVCEASGTELVLAYLPPPSSGQPHHAQTASIDLLVQLGADPSIIALSDRVADAWLAFLQDRRIHHVDLRPVLRAEPERAYWQADHHLATLGHRRVAEALLHVVWGLVE